MGRKLFKFAFLFLFAAACSPAVFGQAPAGRIAGTVADGSGAVIPGADVMAKNDATGQELMTVTGDNGTYLIPSVPSGTYTVAVSVTGFKKAVIKDVKVEVGTPATVNATLEIGAQAEEVIVTGGAEVLQTQSANVSTTIQGRQITELPFTSRDALDLVLMLPGTTTPGRPRSSSINALPRGSLNITIDGVNVQDNLLKSDDGFFTYIRPRIDAVEEVTVSTANPGAESSSEGAVAVKFVTRQGTNAYHGSLYEYYRSPGLNANTFFINRDGAKNCDGRACREKIILHQPGGRVGGPIVIPGLFDGRDKAFFFVNYEEFRLPEQFARTRTILSPDAQKGIFKYVGGPASGINLFQLAAANSHVATPDPTVANLLGSIRGSTSGTGNITQTSDPNLQYFDFTNTGGQVRRFPTVRFDFNFTTKHHLENTWNLQRFNSKIDFLNNVDPQFPGFPLHGSQTSWRFSDSLALRSTLTSRLVNEARFGLTGGTSLFFGDVSPAGFSDPIANMDGYALNMSSAGITNAYNTNAPSRRNSPTKMFNDNLTWTKGSHNINLGFNFTQINLWSESFTYLVPPVTLAMDSTDPANSMFTVANFPGSSSSDQGRAAAIYSVLTGRVTGISGRGVLNESSGKYVYNGAAVERARQREMGMYVQDSWRMKPGFTLNYGLRWEIQYPFTTLNNYYSYTSNDQLYGISGVGNVFKPGITASGKQTQFVQFKPGDAAYPTKYKNLAPTFGFAWTPDIREGILGKILGSGSQSVFRGGYSIAFNREGTQVVSSILGANPGGYVTATKNVSTGNLGTLPVLFRDKSRLAPPPIPESPVYPLTGAVTDSANAFDPSIRLGYVQSWSMGWQRELNKNTVLEVRYLGNHGTKLWRQYNLNETNVIENGMFNEFRLAMANLQANIAAGGARNGSIAYFGPGTGTSPLPITLAYLNGLPSSAADTAGSYTGSSWKSTTYVNQLFPGNPAPITYANNLNAAATQRSNATKAGLPANFFVVNPDKLGGAWTVDNGGGSTYNALTIELRRRLSKGLLVQGNYTYGKAMTDMFGSSSSVSYGYSTLRRPGLSKTLSPWNITHALKVNWIYEMPFGKGKPMANNLNGVMDRLIGGWEFHGMGRVQSGSPFNLGNVQLVGMSVDDLRKAVRIWNDDAAKITYYLPQDIILNTRRAWNVTSTGYSSLGAPQGRYIAPANNGGCIGRYPGECGYSNVVLFGPRFVRFDLSAVKRIKVTEGTNFEIRAEFLDAFNNKNIMVQSASNATTTLGSSGYSGATFGQTLNSYRDTSTTNDPGCRLIQFVARFNF
jgi:hypothetical protein